MYTQHEGIAKGAYGLATFCIVIMLVAEMVKESADIIHEMTPTTQQLKEIGVEIFTPNYDAPKSNEHNSG